MLPQMPSVDLGRGLLGWERQRGCLGMCLCHCAGAVAVSEGLGGGGAQALPGTHSPSFLRMASITGKPGR